PNDAFAQYFDGQSYLAPVSSEQIPIYNVTFEPGCRNHWHIHHAKYGGGQMLICVGGRGYYQEWGKEAVLMTPGTVINIPAEVKHWHGAAPDSWLSHLAIEIEGEDASNEWCESISEEDYLKAISD
ncbi:MAG: cupin domain-containing protein, partial [Oribacterium sp.]|nr:cupin domain-containing protein [Oribacterium sp.]